MNIHAIILSNFIKGYRVSAMIREAITDTVLTTVEMTESLYPLF